MFLYLHKRIIIKTIKTLEQNIRDRDWSAALSQLKTLRAQYELLSKFVILSNFLLERKNIQFTLTYVLNQLLLSDPPVKVVRSFLNVSQNVAAIVVLLPSHAEREITTNSLLLKKDSRKERLASRPKWKCDGEYHNRIELALVIDQSIPYPNQKQFYKKETSYPAIRNPHIYKGQPNDDHNNYSGANQTLVPVTLAMQQALQPRILLALLKQDKTKSTHFLKDEHGRSLLHHVTICAISSRRNIDDEEDEENRDHSSTLEAVFDLSNNSDADLFKETNDATAINNDNSSNTKENTTAVNNANSSDIKEDTTASSSTKQYSFPMQKMRSQKYFEDCVDLVNFLCYQSPTIIAQHDVHGHTVIDITDQIISQIRIIIKNHRLYIHKLPRAGNKIEASRHAYMRSFLNRVQYLREEFIRMQELVQERQAKIDNRSENDRSSLAICGNLEDQLDMFGGNKRQVPAEHRQFVHTPRNEVL